MHKIGGAHLQCVNNHYAKFEDKGMKSVGVTVRHHLSILDGKMSKFNTHANMRKYSRNVHKIEGVHLLYVNNHYAKFEFKEIKSVGVTDYTNQTPSKYHVLIQHPRKNEKIIMKCAQNRRCTSSMCEQS